MIEAAVQRCSQEKVFWKYAANLQENAHTEVQSNFIEITLRHRCSVVNLQHIFRTPFPKNTSGWMLLEREYERHENTGKYSFSQLLLNIFFYNHKEILIKEPGFA